MAKNNSKISNRSNLKIEKDDNAKTLTITVNLDESAVEVTPSSSGKSMVLATTSGAVRADDLSINMTVYRKL